MRNFRIVHRASLTSVIAQLVIFVFPCVAQAQTQLGPYIQSASPTFNYVDPRQPQGTAAGAPAQGIDTITVTFSEPVGDFVTWTTPEILEPLSKENFELAFYKSGQWIENADLTLPSSPIINSVTGSGRGPYTLSLSQRIPLGAWTVLYAKDIVGQSGNLLVASNGAIRLILGNRPMDIDGNGLHSFSDWVRWRSYAQGTLSPAPMVLVDYLDIDRSGGLSLPGLLSDTFRARQLLDGPPPLQAWKAYDMGPKPPADCATNQPPQAIFTYRQTGPSNYDFDAAGSVDTPETGWPGYLAGFRWTFDGNQFDWVYYSDTGHFNNSAEPFEVTLIVMDYCGATAESTVLVTPAPVVPLTINGTVLFSGGPVIGVPVTAQSNSATFNDSTDAQGNYSITVSGNNTYTVTPSFNGYSFTPSGFTNPVVVNGQPRQGINFTVTETSTSPTATRVTDYSLGSTPVKNVTQYPMPISFGGRLYFIANLDNTGYEIWSTDGSTNNTVRLKDIFPGANGPNINNWTVVGSYLYFDADDRVHGTELWRTNGTAAGTVLVKDIAEGSFPSLPSNFIAVGNTVYFNAWDENFNSSLWKSDGTSLGTVMVKDYNSEGIGEVTLIANLNNTLYFVASTPANGKELWKSNGTAASTTLVKDIRPGSGSSNPDDFLVVGSLMYFKAEDGTNGKELWKSDGTPGGTVLVKDINPGSAHSNPYQLTNVNGTLYFVADNGTNGAELWKSNGTINGTILVKDISSNSSGVNNLTNVNGTLFFRAGTVETGPELWKSDGTENGTVLVKDLFPGGGSSSPSYFISYNNALYFTAFDAQAGRELWKSDGTASGTAVFRDLAPGRTSSNPLFPFVVNTKLYFQTGIDDSLWVSDGTANGTTLVKIPGEWGSLTMEMSPLGATLLFEGALDSSGEELWKTGGTGPTEKVRDIYAGAPGSDLSNCKTLGTVTYCAANDGTTGVELWKTTGTPQNTTLVKDINPGSSGSYPAHFTLVNGTVFFTADDGTSGVELWKTDGTIGGTQLVKDILPGISDSTPMNLIEVNGLLLFSADDNVKGRELWRSNGTESGTELVSDIRVGTNGSWPNELTKMNDQVYFGADDGTSGYELWKSNGTSSGTTRVIDLLPGANSSIPNYLVVMNGALYFLGHNSQETTGLWKSNGTASGTTRLFDPTQYSPLQNGPLVPMDGKLYFSQFDYDYGDALWVSDGTLAGTKMLKDLIPGAPDVFDINFRFDSGPKNLTAVGRTLFFTFDDGVSGLELWKSNGTGEGTVMTGNINPGPAPSSPRNLTAVGNILYFMAHDGTTGYEIWKY